jgi:trehalose utilization protein
VPAHFELLEEMYGEPFYIPKPDDLIFTTWYQDGNIFRGGATFTRGLGKIFYFHPGHEFCRSFYDPIVQRIIKNAIKWCAPINRQDGFIIDGCIHQTEPIIK